MNTTSGRWVATLLALATVALGTTPVLAAETITTTTTSVSSTAVAPPVVLINGSGKASIIETRTFGTPVAVTTGIIVYAYTPSFLVTRRNDLLARIIIEKSRGVLDAAQANDLIARVDAIDSARATLPLNDECVAYFEQVKDMFHDFDDVAQDMQTMSGQGNKELANTYEVVSM